MSGVSSCLQVVTRSILTRRIYNCLNQPGFSQAISTTFCSMKGKSNIAVGGELACFVVGSWRFKISSQSFRKLMRCFRGFLQSLDECNCYILTDKNCIAQLVLLWENIAELVFGWIYNTDDLISPSVNIYSLRETCNSVPIFSKHTSSWL